MPWFKVDDGFHSHPKVLRAGNAAVGLWTRCGSWCSDQLTDGFVPDEIARMYGTRKEVATLLDVGLWFRVDGGYVMHDFGDYNPTAEAVTALRAAAAERQRNARERAKSQRESRRDSHVSHGSSHAPPDPTRPDPSYLHAQDPINGVVAALGERFKDHNP